MGLIERVVAQEFADSSDIARQEPPSIGGPTFDLDFDALAKRGAFTPDRFGKAPTQELRAIKRALLKRLGLLHGGGRNRESLRSGGRRRNLVVVTSTRPGEGKTFMAVNLALSFAIEERLSVLLIDGDAMRPKVRGYFDLPEGPGFTDRLATPSLSLATLAWRANAAPLAVLGEGTRQGAATDLYSSDVARSFFAGVSTAAPNRLVIVDAPPMLATTDAFALARHADETVFVVQADATPQPAVTLALDELLEVNQNVSLVLNRCLVPGGGSHYGSYEDYYTYGADRRPTGNEKS
ncbi:MAG: hypothetical protein GC152_14355 [Alphaproteobacteria bacterium]|nr:hypothetical protein [Alphaproteobacteria bacterium]